MSSTTEPINLTGSLEDYLETIFLLVADHGFARVRDIAKARDVKAGSVSPALKRLSDLGLIRYERREYVGLTLEGELAARRVLARHDLLRRFFSEILQMPDDAAEREACAIEHVLSPEAMDRLVRLFEFLSACPESQSEWLRRFHHCSLVQPELEKCENACCRSTLPSRIDEKFHNVFQLKPGHEGTIRQVRAQGAVRQRLLDMGMLPQVVVRMERAAPGGDPVWISLNGSQLALRRAEAETIIVTEL
ncbi:MAG: DtxR family transcriptional regulator [Myxococcota bacterium]|jgi:DtxR family Mn-dependent transcriptional regulator|nr:DtxR family transcriptional regulator [Myxococcota bacterium]